MWLGLGAYERGCMRRESVAEGGDGERRFVKGEKARARGGQGSGSR